VSLGGYFAPRAAAFESRAKACVGLSGPYRWIDVFDKANELTREAFRVRTRCASADEAREMAGRFTLEGVAKNIRCPLLIMAGTRDTLIPDEHGRRAVAEAGPQAKLLMVEGGSHVSNNVWYRYRPQVADFLAAHLGARG
jgi:2,6-dihydroxypseudooxynicotine hydrolase